MVYFEDDNLKCDGDQSCIEDLLKETVDLYPDKFAVKCGEESCTYRQLWDKVVSRARVLCREYGTDNKDGKISSSLDKKPIPFRNTQDIDFLVEYFAIHLAGGVAVPLERDMPDEVFRDYQRKLTRSGILKGLRRKKDRKYIADILFTTGTTGKSKGVMLSCLALVEDGIYLSGTQRYHHDLDFIITGPLNHFGNLSKVYAVIIDGGTLHILDGMKDLNAFFDTMDKEIGPSRTKRGTFRKKPKFATFLVPASIRMLLTFAKDRLASYANRLEFIETGGAPISQVDMEQLCAILPKSRLYNTYASTEAGVMTTYNFNCANRLVGCVGTGVNFTGAVFVIPDDKELYLKPLFPRIGRAYCSGETLMSGYYDDEELTKSVFCLEGLKTSDLAESRDPYHLFLKGRVDDVINVGGYKVSPAEVENAAFSVPVIEDCICIPVEHRVLGTVLKLLYVVRDGFAVEKRQIALMLKEHLESYKVPTMYEQVESINRTYNGKLDRKSYTNDSSSIQ